jgi:hypothetical protein
MHYSNSEANAAAERELDRSLNRHMDDVDPPLKEFVVTCEITLEASSKEEALELMRAQLKPDHLRWVDVIDTDIIGVKEQ